MTRYFYGVYLQNATISTALDLIRFLGEPDSIRYSHITLRGPYKAPLSRQRLIQIRNDVRFDWKVRLAGAGNFFAYQQSTVLVEIDLMSLKDLVHKPDFPSGIPHLTLYDGKDGPFAKRLFEIVQGYEWQGILNVTPLREIDPKHRINETFLPLFESFCDLFARIFGDPSRIHLIRDLSSERRLALIRRVLELVMGNSFDPPVSQQSEIWPDKADLPFFA